MGRKTTTDLLLSEVYIESLFSVFMYVAALSFRPSSFATIVISVSVFVQAFVFISIGAFADYGALRKKLLIVTSTLGALSVVLIITAVRDSLWWYAGILTIFANVFFGSSSIFYNAFLPLIVSAHPTILKLEETRADYNDIQRERLVCFFILFFVIKINLENIINDKHTWW